MAFIKMDFFSQSLLRTVTVNAVIPLDKMNLHGESPVPSRPFKTLYLLHGIFGNCNDWTNHTRIQRWAEKMNLAVIMPSGDNHFYVDCEATGEQYGEFIGKELVDFTRKMFPLSLQRDDTFIGGLSMGGYGAMRNGLKYHHTFSRIISLSGGFTFEHLNEKRDDARLATSRKSFFNVIFGDLSKVKGSDMDLRALTVNLKAQNAETPAIYMCIGTDDFLLEDTRSFKAFMEEQQVPVTYEEGAGAHEWDFWDTYLKKALDWLVPEKSYHV